MARNSTGLVKGDKLQIRIPADLKRRIIAANGKDDRNVPLHIAALGLIERGLRVRNAELRRNADLADVIAHSQPKAESTESAPVEGTGRQHTP